MPQIEYYFKVFCKISEAIQTQPDREAILKLIVESAAEAMNAKACSLFMIKSTKEPDEPFYPVANTGLSESYIHTGLSSHKIDSIRETLVKDGYLISRDATTDPRLENHEIKKREGIASLLVVPVKAERKPIGVLALYTADSRDFSKPEIDFLAALANQGGLAIVRAHKDYRIKRDIGLFAALSEHLSSSLDIREVLKMMTSEIAGAIELKGVTIRLLDNGSNELKLVSSYGLSDKYLHKGPISATREKAFFEKKVEYIEDVQEQNDIDYKKERIEEGITSMLHLPITIKGNTIGLMGLYATRRRSVSEDDIKLARSIATQCGLAIHNASMYLQLKEEKKSLEEEIWGHKSWF
ncbi:GAF domain-containing protein [Desulforhopalus singaporensis]|uniref:GAF domain-containing protein n=1 Tax=Desulforhopalus singaporensis TaxID=91360 RepID=A0A1H0J1J7_9BACT|nr:GAF domain-containing protein [Desulforhopalus singaporensis]SDO37585.1 GAF domain-containing protein [Desulforhopalus singaporensis]